MIGLLGSGACKLCKLQTIGPDRGRLPAARRHRESVRSVGLTGRDAGRIQRYSMDGCAFTAGSKRSLARSCSGADWETGKLAEAEEADDDDDDDGRGWRGCAFRMGCAGVAAAIVLSTLQSDVRVTWTLSGWVAGLLEQRSCFMRCQEWHEVDHCAHHWAVCISVGTVVSAREVSHGGGCERGDPSEKSKMTAARRREARHGGRRAGSDRACHKIEKSR